MIEIAETDTIQPVLDRFMEIDTMPSVEAGRQGVRGAGRAGACALSEETRASLLGDLRR